MNKYASDNYEEESVDVRGGSAFNMLESDKVLYISPDQEWTTFDEGTIPTNENHKLAYNSMPAEGDTGVFKIGDKVSTPFEIVAIEKTASTDLSVNSYHIIGKDSTLFMSKTGAHEISEDTVDNILL